MKKKIAFWVLALFIMSVSSALANLDDNRTSMAAKYGEYRLVIDKAGHLWTRADWESGVSTKSKAGAYVYYFTRSGLNMQMEVQYEGDNPDSRVTIQRVTPDSEIKIQDFKDYFPEVYALTIVPQAQVFATRRELTRNFKTNHSPVTLGVLVNGIPAGKGAYSTLMAFNVQAPGQLIKDPKDISKDLYIHEFTIERADEMSAVNRGGETIKSPF